VEFLVGEAIGLFGDDFAATVPMAARRSSSLETIVRNGMGYLNGNFEIF
jgi:hypothetical protein